MTDLYVVLGSVAVVVGMLATIVWLARGAGESDVKRARMRKEIKRRAKMEKLLARRHRNRSGVVDWLRRHGDK